MVCVVDTSLDGTICEFSVTYALNSFMTGNLKLIDCDCVYDPGCNEPCRPICVTIAADLLADFDTSLAEIQACHQDPPDWLCGLADSYGFSYQDSTSSAGVVPYSDYLHNKPINTQQFCGSELSEVIPIVLQYYGGLSPNVFCIEENGIYGFEDECRIKGPIEGNNLLTELAKLAQAGCASLFTQVGGKLTIEKWKDHESDIEFEIPCEYVVTAEKAQFNPNRTTGILMRGAQVDSVDCGQNSLTSNDQGPGPTKKCVFSGIKTPSVNVQFNNLSGTSEDINNSTVIASGENGQTVSNLTSTQNGTATGEVSASSGNQIGCTPECVNVQINGTNNTNSTNTQNGFTTQTGFNEFGGYGWGANHPNPYNRFDRLLNNSFPVPYYMFGLGNFSQSLGPRSSSNTNGNFSDQPSRSQCEIFVTNDDNNICGEFFEDHENRYIYDKEQLFKIAIRRMQELKMADNVWNVELPYLPCLKINQVVTFVTPEFQGTAAPGDPPACPARTIKGIVAGLSVEYRKTSESELPIKMKAVILDTACLEGITYTSGNLINSLCAHSGASELNPWQAAEYSLDQGSGVNDCLFMFGVGNSNSFLNYTHEKLNPDCNYTLSYDWEFIQGTGTVTLDVGIDGSNAGAAVHVGGPTGSSLFQNSGSESFTIPRSDGQLTLDFQMLNPPTATYFKVYNLQLIATCTT